MKIFHHEQISHENIQQGIFPNYGIMCSFVLYDVF